MAIVQSTTFLNSFSNSSFPHRKKPIIKSAINFPKIHTNNISTKKLVQELITNNINKTNSTQTVQSSDRSSPDPLVVAKLHAIMEAVAERVEMHKNVGQQRDNWNSLLLTSVNSIILGAATMAAISTVAPEPTVKISSGLLYLGATGLLTLMNKIQPSQLVEEQRNATRIFKSLYNEINTTLSIGHPTCADVRDYMERVLALDKAFPLPLLGAMLEKFPETMAPAVWWPTRGSRKPPSGTHGWNGWNGKLEDDLREVTRVLLLKDKEDYLRLGKKALTINKVLAIAGPFLTFLGAIGSFLPGNNPFGVILGVVIGALSTIVNTFQHGGQVGMVFEMYRCSAGFFQLIEESIESNLSEKEMERRENGEVFEMKVALKLGRSLSELRDLASKSSTMKQDIDEFGCKLF